MHFEGLIEFKTASKERRQVQSPMCFEYRNEESYINLLLKGRPCTSSCIRITQTDFQTSFSSNVPSEFFTKESTLEDFMLLADRCILDIALDYRDDQIILARNHFGTVPLYYIHIPNQFIAFSSNLATLVKNDRVKPFLEINLTLTSRYCRFGAETGRRVSSETFYTKIHSVLPGHTLLSNFQEVRQVPYLTFQPKKWKNLKTAEDFSSNIRLILESSIANCASAGQLGSYLSGGLDSSSVSAITKYLFPDKSLHTYYGDCDTILTQERHHAVAVAEKIGSIHHNVTPCHNDLESHIQFVEEFGQPKTAITTPSFQGTIIDLAIENGVDTILSGHEGDSVAGFGFEYVYEQLDSGQFSQFQKLLEERIDDPFYSEGSRNWDKYSKSKKISRILHRSIGSKLAVVYRTKGIVKAFRLFLEYKPIFNLSALYYVRRWLIRLPHILFLYKDADESIIAHTLKVPDSSDHWRVHFDIEGVSQDVRANINNVFSVQCVSGSEEIFTLANINNISCPIPLLNRELLELSAMTPSSFKYGNKGLGRSHFRDAVKDLLPDQVLARTDKASFSIYGVESTRRLLEQSTDLLHTQSTLWKIVDKAKFEKKKRLLLDENLPLSIHRRVQRYVFRTISMAIWLNWLKRNNVNIFP